MMERPERPSFQSLLENQDYSNMLKSKLNNDLQHSSTYSKIIDELVTTEQTYVDSLQTIIKGFKRNFEKLQYIKPEEVQVLFCNIEELHALHSELLQKMKQGKVINEQDDSWTEMYAKYCSNHTRAAKALESYYQRDNMKAFFLGCRLLMSQDISIEGFLLVPIQRLCRYPLLLKELLKHTEPGDSYMVHWLALERVKHLAEIVNEMKRIEENEKMYQKLTKGMTEIDLIEKQLGIKNQRLVICSLNCQKISHKKQQARSLFLLDKMLIYAKSNLHKRKSFQMLLNKHQQQDLNHTIQMINNGKFNDVSSMIDSLNFLFDFRGAILLNNLVVEDLEDGIVVHGITLKNAWKIERHDQKKKTYYIIMNNETEKKRWMKAFETLKREQ